VAGRDFAEDVRAKSSVLVDTDGDAYCRDGMRDKSEERRDSAGGRDGIERKAVHIGGKINGGAKRRWGPLARLSWRRRAPDAVADADECGKAVIAAAVATIILDFGVQREQLLDEALFEGREQVNNALQTSTRSGQNVEDTAGSIGTKKLACSSGRIRLAPVVSMYRNTGTELDHAAAPGLPSPMLCIVDARWKCSPTLKQNNQHAQNVSPLPPRTNRERQHSLIRELLDAREGHMPFGRLPQLRGALVSAPETSPVSSKTESREVSLSSRTEALARAHSGAIDVLLPSMAHGMQDLQCVGEGLNFGAVEEEHARRISNSPWRSPDQMKLLLEGPGRDVNFRSDEDSKPAWCAGFNRELGDDACVFCSENTVHDVADCLRTTVGLGHERAVTTESKRRMMHVLDLVLAREAVKALVRWDEDAIERTGQCGCTCRREGVAVEALCERLRQSLHRAPQT
jgi:hypothetical protein